MIYCRFSRSLVPFSSRSPEIYDDRMVLIEGKAFQRPTQKFGEKIPLSVAVARFFTEADFVREERVYTVAFFEK